LLDACLGSPLAGSQGTLPLAICQTRCHDGPGLSSLGIETSDATLMTLGRRMTGSPAGSPTARRRELGIILRRLRVERGLTVQDVAERLLISPSKVSRLETAQRGAHLRDIRDLCLLYDVSDNEREKLAELVAEGRRPDRWQGLDLPDPTYMGLEADAVTIRDFALGMVPGLLQTADYARAHMRASFPRSSARVIEVRIQVRLDRQAHLLGSGSPAFTALIDESVLHRVAGSRAIMHGQLSAMLEVSSLPGVTIRVVPFTTGALPTPSFVILSFASAALNDVVYVEGLTGELTLDRDSDVEAYHDAYNTLTGMAATVEQSREIIASRERTYRD
jgi:transcriptional regulator with XRE-family HTH domain